MKPSETKAVVQVITMAEEAFDRETTALGAKGSRRLMPQILARRDEYHGIIRLLKPLVREVPDGE